MIKINNDDNNHNKLQVVKLGIDLNENLIRKIEQKLEHIYENKNYINLRN
jgi:hypothetical protein